jgi:hypothetical protein
LGKITPAFMAICLERGKTGSQKVSTAGFLKYWLNSFFGIKDIKDDQTLVRSGNIMMPFEPPEIGNALQLRT